MKEAFINHKFSIESIETVKTVNSILDEYRHQGYRLSLRQLYYQMVARDFISNSQKSYKNFGSLISTARQAGRIDWEMIEDRNRETRVPVHWETPAQIVEAAAQQFRVDKWTDQPFHIEVMVEKDALSGVLEPICRQLDIAITANKGYSSSSTMYEIGKRLYRKFADENKDVCIFYLGDHDPSGIDMTRDIEERLLMYSTMRSGELEVVRLALNWDQIEQWKPPENPAKQTDSRFAAYAETFGESSWELDAVEPSQLANLVRTAVLERRDDQKWNETMAAEESMRAELLDFVNKYGN